MTFRGKTPAMDRWERKHSGRDVRDEIERLQRTGLSQVEIARVLKVNASTVSRWMERLGIPARRAVWTIPTEAAS